MGLGPILCAQTGVGRPTGTGRPVARECPVVRYLSNVRRFVSVELAPDFRRWSDVWYVATRTKSTEVRSGPDDRTTCNRAEPTDDRRPSDARTVMKLRTTDPLRTSDATKTEPNLRTSEPCRMSGPSRASGRQTPVCVQSIRPRPMYPPLTPSWN